MFDLSKTKHFRCRVHIHMSWFPPKMFDLSRSMILDSVCVCMPSWFRQIKHFDSIMHWVFYQTSKYENVLLNHGSHGSLKSYMSTTGCQKTKTLNWKSAETEYSKFMHILFQTSGCWKLVDTLWCLRRSMHEFQVWQSQFFRTERSTVHHFWETNHTLFWKENLHSITLTKPWNKLFGG